MPRYFSSENRFKVFPFDCVHLSQSKQLEAVQCAVGCDHVQYGIEQLQPAVQVDVSHEGALHIGVAWIGAVVGQLELHKGINHGAIHQCECGPAARGHQSGQYCEKYIDVIECTRVS